MQGLTALHLSLYNLQFAIAISGFDIPQAAHGCIESVTALLLHGADVNAEDHSVCFKDLLYLLCLGHD